MTARAEMPAGVAADSSVVVAALLAWHEHHAAARQELEAAMEQFPLLIPVPALVESYAVMTRLPAPHRLRPADAYALLRENFAASARADGLSGEECWALLERLAAGTVAGGRTYDAQILAAAVKSRARVLLTLNVAHFAPLAPEGMEIRSPV
ncbi:MAG: PIN domain-containing protein [Candidatus Latescibacterota bacterium]